MNADAEKDLEMLRKSAEALGEHWDSVQIFCTRHESGAKDGTVNVKYGLGNWFSRYGQIREWLIASEEDTRVSVRKNRDE